MKTIKLSLLIIAAVTTLYSCKKNNICIKGNGNTITETRNLSDFNQIDLKTSDNIILTQGNEYSIEIEASENLMSVIETSVTNSKLKITRKPNTCIKTFKPITIYITTPDINQITISGSGDVKATDLITSPKMDLTINGSGNMQFSNLNTDHLDTKVSGSGKLTISSTEKTTSQLIKISGSGNINVLNMPSKETTISISGSGDCVANTIENLDVKISGSGNVKYKGSPTINSKITGSGSLKKY